MAFERITVDPLEHAAAAVNERELPVARPA
jgi:hypothetical protein